MRRSATARAMTPATVTGLTPHDFRSRVSPAEIDELITSRA
jgi:hypothetical protein